LLLLARSELHPILSSPTLVIFVSPLDSPFTLMIEAAAHLRLSQRSPKVHNALTRLGESYADVLDSNPGRDMVILIEIIRVFT
jgi:hypothetical protein